MSGPGWTKPKKDDGIIKTVEVLTQAQDDQRRTYTDDQTRNQQPTYTTSSTTFTTQIVTATAQYHGLTAKVEVGPSEEVIVAVNIDVEIEDLGGVGALSSTLFTLVRTNGSLATGTTYTTLGRGRQEMYKGTATGNKAQHGMQFYAVDKPPTGVQTYRLIAEQSSANIGTRINSQFWYLTKRIAKVGG
jgi:hypothetical protein